ncbi:MAG TPA: hypothetical protein VEB23_07975 [Ramlibacter sp.]|nr:hypothetical protein [Ramlibacter sp.]
MSFVRAATPRFFAPAAFSILDADGQLVVSKFDCEFKRLRLSEQKQLQADVSQWSEEVVKKLQAKVVAITARAKASGAEEDGAPDPAAQEEAEREAQSVEITLQDMVNRRLLERVMCGWRGVTEADGTPALFSLAKVDETEEIFPGFINACADAYWASQAPKAAAHLAARKN